MANRRNKNRKIHSAGRGSMRGWVLLAFGFSSVFIIGGIGSQISNLESIKRIDFNGELKYLKKNQLADSIKSIPMRNFFFIDTDSMQAKLMSIPWVETVKINRLWPDRINISVKEKKAIARWASGGLLSEKGRLFYPDKNQYPPNLPLVSANKGTNATVAVRLLQFQDSLAKVRLEIKSLKINPRGVWSLILDNGLTIIVGRELFEQRVDRFAYVYSSLKNNKNISSIDLRYANGIAVRTKNKLLRNNG